MYGMVHTMVTIMYALNVLSRYSNNPGPRHSKFIKHLVMFVKHSKNDRLIFRTPRRSFQHGVNDRDTATTISM